MLVAKARRVSPRELRRLQLYGALVITALLPWLLRLVFLPGTLYPPADGNTVWANAAAVLLAIWLRSSIETYPGNRATFVILPTTISAHAAIFTLLLLTRIPYDRLALATAVGFHLFWNYFLYFYGERRARPRIGIVPFGRVDHLNAIPEVSWHVLTRAELADCRGYNALVADFASDLPSEWEAFLADAALSGRIVYQVKQLTESLTGRVELSHLSENNWGALVPARGYFYVKSAVDVYTALMVLPIVALPMIAIALWIVLDSGRPVFYQQTRVGHAGRKFQMHKFRTMRVQPVADAREAAITRDDDERITRVGAFLRQFRLDELPQIINVVKGEMSWIGPRPEAESLSQWYAGELSFYRYRHVVKPGISGWAQVNQGHVTDIGDIIRKLQYDFYYIKYFSPWLDMLIVMRTFRTVFTGFGSR